MRLFVGVTDRNWYEHLSRMRGLDEGNFWQPFGRGNFRASASIQPSHFELHGTNSPFVGGIYFQDFSEESFTIRQERRAP